MRICKSLLESIACLWLALGVASVPASAAAQAAREVPSAARYIQGAPTADGIGKRFMGREIARVMGWQGAAWLEREEREREERTDLLLPALQLKPGMQVADVGAGTGYFSWRMSRLVGPQGRVFAADVQPEMIGLLRRTMAERGAGNVEPVQSAPNDTGLPAAALDLAILVDVYHELEFPYEVIASVVRALKPGGRLVLVEYRGEDPNVPIKAAHKMTEAQVRAEIAAHGQLAWDRTNGALPWQHVIVFRKR